MIERLTAGSILMAEGSVMPACIAVETDTYSPGWGMLRGVTRHTMEKAIQAAGWTFFSSLAQFAEQLTASIVSHQRCVP